MRSMTPYISIITPSYNQGCFIEETIKSVISQTYKDFEYIVIDGGSTDGTISILRRYSDQITYWESVPDEGQTHALIKGFERARGTYVCWQNSDDLFCSRSLEYLAKVAKATNAPIVSGHLRLCDENGSVFREIRYSPVAYRDLPFIKASIPNQCAIFRRDIYERVGGFNKTLRYCMDYDLWSRILLYSGGTNKVVGKALGIYRVHKDTKTNLLSDVHNYERDMLSRKIINSIPTDQVGTIFRKLIYHMLAGDLFYLANKIWLKAKKADSWE